jgi:hypothetical protein
MHLPNAHVSAFTVAMLLSVAGCSGDSASSPGDSSASVSTQSAQRCPNPHGGVCLGRLEPGVYTTAQFIPTLTYSVPAGWDNEEDLYGNFLLVPPGGSLAGGDAGTDDYIGIYTAVTASGGCDLLADAGISPSPQRITASIRQDPDLVVTRPEPTEVGGLRGLVMDIKLAEDPSRDCPSPGGSPAVPLIHGVAPSSFDHAIVDGLTMRLYLLGYDGGSLAIEVDDLHRGRHLTAYSELIGRFDFRD